MKECITRCDLCKKPIDENHPDYYRSAYRSDGLNLHLPCAVKLDAKYKTKYDELARHNRDIERKYKALQLSYKELKQKKLNEIKELIFIK